MARSLDVYLHQHLTGSLIQDDGGQMLFQYDPNWLQNPEAIPLSRSLPLQQEPFTRRQCAGFFGGILPEQVQRKIIAKILGISEGNDFAMLEQIGGECAGAVTFLPAGQPLLLDEPAYHPLPERQLAETLHDLPQRPLMAGEDGIRLSLAGAQGKLAVRMEDRSMSIPLGNAPSTHILKPAPAEFEGLVNNEALCMKLARAIDLNVAPVEVGHADSIDYLLVERYDRILFDESRTIRRLHQEDFCQAMGVVSENKYQNEGGPSLKQSFELLREASSTPVLDLRAMLDAVIFNYLIGNTDAHGKNFSLLYSNGGGIRLAPLYDLVCTIVYPKHSRRMAMKIGGEYDCEAIQPVDFERFAEEAELSKILVMRRIPVMAQWVLEALPPLASFHEGVAEIIRNRCDLAILRFKR